ncbi:MAG: N-6 DNA methylase, partial [Ktedonobacterales bacterium]
MANPRHNGAQLATQPQLTIGEKDKAIATYYATLDELAGGQGVQHEGGLRRAFETLLAHYAAQMKWTLIGEVTLDSGVRPDGVLRDASLFYRGYWEAKDTHDKLDEEIEKKIRAGYPLANTIFEDTQRAVLYQNGKRIGAFDLRLPRELADLLRTFFGHREAEIENFETAMAAFQERIPDLARELKKLIADERSDTSTNAAFRDAFASFYALCQTAIDPRISIEAVEEMLVQHLLTERLFRTIFNNPDFTRRNAVAAEIERVIDTLTARSFNRDGFLQGLDRYYLAVEGAAVYAARGEDGWTEKQRFLNLVYERFFQGFSVRQADTHGIVYTPQEIVNFMCASVEEVLTAEFGRALADPGVQILDPATGTGNFIVNLLRRIPARSLPQKYAHDLFCNEIMLLPYYIASLNIEHAYYSLTGQYQPFEGICFADTLELAERVVNREGVVEHSLWISEKNSERVEREKQAPIMVVIGNPPYNVGQVSENDNNKNRRYPTIDGRIRDTYAKDSKATLKNKLYDAYVKFFRWATDRLQGRDGIV